MDTLRTNCLLSRGLLQLTALSLVVSAAAGVVSTTDKPPPSSSTRAIAFQPATGPHSSGVFTFNQPGRSFVEYRHAWPSLRSALRLIVRLRFRTTRPAGILTLLSSVREGPPTTSNTSGIVPPTTLIRLHGGSLHVSVISSRDQNRHIPAQSGIVVGRGRCRLLIN